MLLTSIDHVVLREACDLRWQLRSSEGPNLVRTLMTRLAEEGEDGWLGWLCCELAVQV